MLLIHWSILDKTETLDIDSLNTKLVDSVALTAVCNSDINACMRDAIKKDMNSDYQAICSNANPVTKQLIQNRTVKVYLRIKQALTQSVWREI